jgi:hypothetical protein
MDASELSYWHISFVGNGSVERVSKETGDTIRRSIVDTLASGSTLNHLVAECENIEGAPVLIFVPHIAVMVWSTPETRATSYAIEAALEKEQDEHEPRDWNR